MSLEARIDAVGHAICVLDAHNHVWKTEQRLVLSQPRLAKPTIYAKLSREAHWHTIAIGLRRQLDSDQGQISLMSVILEVARNAGHFTKDRFVAAYATIGNGVGERQYEWVCRGVAADHYPKELADKHADKLNKYGKPLYEFASSVLAHRNQKPAKPLRITRMDHLINYMRRLQLQYSLVIQQRHGSFPVTDILCEGWQDPLHYPWISPDATRHL